MVGEKKEKGMGEEGEGERRRGRRGGGRRRKRRRICISRILTKSSNPRRVPTISLSDFIMMCIREPIHLSTNSREKRERVKGQGQRGDV